MSGSKIHSVQTTSADENIDNDGEELHWREVSPESREDSGADLFPSSAASGAAIQDSNQPGSLDAQELGLAREQAHAPWPGRHSACGVCGVPSVSPGLGPDRQSCEYCDRPVEGAVGKRKKNAGGARRGGTRLALEKEVAVTSSREITLDDEHVQVLMWTGVVMLGTSSLLFLLLLSAW